MCIDIKIYKYIDNAAKQNISTYILREVKSETFRGSLFRLVTHEHQSLRRLKNCDYQCKTLPILRSDILCIKYAII